MMCDPAKVIRIALAEVGYHEKETSSQLDDPSANAGDGNYTKYARDLWKHKYFNGSKSGVAWCAVFVAWDMAEAYGVEAALKLLCQRKGGEGAGAKYAKQYFVEKGQYYQTPEKGDVIFFTRGHMGLVYDVDGNYVYTVEGNTDNQVKEHRYRQNDDSIDGYGRPDYAGVEDGKPGTDEEREGTGMVIRTAYVKVPAGTSTANMRERPDEKADRIKKVSAGTVVDVLEEADGWAKIEDPDGRKGYMMVEFLKFFEHGDVEVPDESGERQEQSDSIMDEVIVTLPRETAKALFKALSEVVV